MRRPALRLSISAIVQAADSSPSLRYRASQADTELADVSYSLTVWLGLESVSSKLWTRGFSMEWSNLVETLALVLTCLVLPSAVAMYFSAPRNTDAGLE